MPASTRAARRELWNDRMRRFSESGLSVKAFCLSEGISVPSFYQWKRKFVQPPSPAASFLPIAIAPPVTDPKVQLPGGAAIELPVAMGTRLMTDVIVAVIEATSKSDAS